MNEKYVKVLINDEDLGYLLEEFYGYTKTDSEVIAGFLVTKYEKNNKPIDIEKEAKKKVIVSNKKIYVEKRGEAVILIPPKFLKLLINSWIEFSVNKAKILTKCLLEEYFNIPEEKRKPIDLNYVNDYYIVLDKINDVDERYFTGFNEDEVLYDDGDYIVIKNK